MTTDEVFEAALALPVRERAALVGQLLASVDGPDDDAVEAKVAWDDEIVRRVDAIEDRDDAGISWDEIHAQARARF